MFGTDLSVLWNKRAWMNRQCPYNPLVAHTTEEVATYNRCVQNIESNYQKARRDAVILGGALFAIVAVVLLARR